MLSKTRWALGFGLFVATFEWVKAQGYLRFITLYYGSLRGDLLSMVEWKQDAQGTDLGVIRPHYTIEPAFLALAGVSASVAQQLVAHPLGRVQDIHYGVVQSQERKARVASKKGSSVNTINPRRTIYTGAYGKTFELCRMRAIKRGAWRTWLYQGFWWNTIRQVPSTAAGLVIFELVRKRCSDQIEDVRIELDGYDIQLR